MPSGGTEFAHLSVNFGSRKAEGVQKELINKELKNRRLRL